MIRLEGPFEFHHPDGEKETVDPESWKSLAPLVVLRKDEISLARTTRTSELRVEFASGCVITSTAYPDYESWEVHAPGKYGEVMVIALPGGGMPAIWDGETPPRHFKMIDGKPVDITDN
jgi:hypothetical protein